MGQEFLGVRCCSCDMLQVIQRPKSGRFSCRVCQCKQSILKVLASSTRARDVREVVQRWNLLRGQAREEIQQQEQTVSSSSSAAAAEAAPRRKEEGSKWSRFVEEEEEKEDGEGDSDAEDFVDGIPVVCAVPERSRRGRASEGPTFVEERKEGRGKRPGRRRPGTETGGGRGGGAVQEREREEEEPACKRRKWMRFEGGADERQGAAQEDEEERAYREELERRQQLEEVVEEEVWVDP